MANLGTFELNFGVVTALAAALVALCAWRMKANWSLARWRSRLYVAVAAIVVLAFSIALWLWARPPALPRNASPEMVARTYFELDAAGRSSAARHFVYHSGLVQAADGTGYGGATFLSATKAWAIGKGGLPSEYDALFSLCELSVNYHTSRTNAIRNPPGDYVAFVELGRVTPSSPWLVLETGTGP
jgi:hypothetical protein